jgi:hypothetical protein
VVTCEGAVYIASKLNDEAHKILVSVYSKRKADDFAKGVATGPVNEMFHEEQQAKQDAPAGSGPSAPVIEDCDESEDSDSGVVTEYQGKNGSVVVKINGGARAVEEYGKYANELKMHSMTMKEAAENHIDAQKIFKVGDDLEIERNEHKRLAENRSAEDQLEKKQRLDAMKITAEEEHMKEERRLAAMKILNDKEVAEIKMTKEAEIAVMKLAAEEKYMKEARRLADKKREEEAKDNERREQQETKDNECREQQEARETERREKQLAREKDFAERQFAQEEAIAEKRARAAAARRERVSKTFVKCGVICVGLFF